HPNVRESRHQPEDGTHRTQWRKSGLKLRSLRDRQPELAVDLRIYQLDVRHRDEARHPSECRPAATGAPARRHELAAHAHDLMSRRIEVDLALERSQPRRTRSGIEMWCH